MLFLCSLNSGSRVLPCYFNLFCCWGFLRWQGRTIWQGRTVLAGKGHRLSRGERGESWPLLMSLLHLLPAAPFIIFFLWLLKLVLKTQELLQTLSLSALRIPYFLLFLYAGVTVGKITSCPVFQYSIYHPDRSFYPFFWKKRECN